MLHAVKIKLLNGKRILGPGQRTIWLNEATGKIIVPLSIAIGILYF
jgi:hypothetical protein